MKKYLLGFFLLILCLLVPHTETVLKAESAFEPLTISTYYPNNIIEYKELNNINHITVNNDLIAYTLSSNEVNITSKSTRETIKFDSFESIFQMKFVDNTLIIIDYNSSSKTGTIKYINFDDQNPVIKTIAYLNLTNLIASDIYYDQYNIFIGIIKNNQSQGVFELYEFTDKNLDTPHLKDTYTNDNFLSATHLLVSSTEHFVVFKKSDNNYRLFNRNYGVVNTTTTDILENNIQLIKQIYHEQQSYLLITTLENLILYSSNNLSTPVTTKTNIQITNIDVFEGKIYTSSVQDESISSLIITTNASTNKLEIRIDNVLICSKNSSIGRFNNSSDTFIQGDTLYVADTYNNRIQTLNQGIAEVIIETPAIDQHPRGVVLDSQQRLYYAIEDSPTSSQFLYYTMENNKYTLNSNYYSYNNIQLGNICDVTVSDDDRIYMIDYKHANNTLVCFNQDTGLQRIQKFTNFTTNSNTRLDYIKELGYLAILNNDTIYLYNPKPLENEQDPFVTSIDVENCKDISCDTNAIYALCQDKILLISITDNIMHISEKQLQCNDFSQFSNITFDIKNRVMYAFNQSTHSLSYFDCDINENTLYFDEINTSENSFDQECLALKLQTNATIYDLPYSIGNTYTGIQDCIGISLQNGYYRVLFNNQNTLQVGFIRSDYVITEDTDDSLKFNTKQKIRVITTNLKVPVYKYPTLLKHSDKAIIVDHIEIDTRILVSRDSFPVQIDGKKKFYLYQTDKISGFIFNADIVLDDNSSIVYLTNNNAKIQAIGEDNIQVLSEDKTSVITTLKNEDRVYVEHFDKNSEYTLISYKDENLNTIKGYIKTEYIEMDQFDSSRTLLVLVIIISVIILLVIIITYFLFRRKKQ